MTVTAVNQISRVVVTRWGLRRGRFLRPSGCCLLIKEASILHNSKSVSAHHGGSGAGAQIWKRLLVNQAITCFGRVPIQILSFNSLKNQWRIDESEKKKGGRGE